MKMSGEELLEASHRRVWEALNDTDVLRRAIPGCEDLERMSDTELAATVAVKIGPVNARFKGDVTLSDLDPPNSYTISGKGKAGAAGVASGSARVALVAVGDTTRLTYEVDAKVGGKIAQLGGRLIDATVKKLADAFFTNLAAEFSEDKTPVEGGSDATRPPPGAPVTIAVPARWVVAAVALGLIVLAALLL